MQVSPDSGVAIRPTLILGEGKTELFRADRDVDIDQLLHIAGLHSDTGKDLLAVRIDPEGDIALVAVLGQHTGMALDLLPGPVEIERPGGADLVEAAGGIVGAVDRDLVLSDAQE